MAGSKRDRQRASRQQQMAAAAEARRRAARRRNALAGGAGAVAVAVIAVVAVLVLSNGDGSKKVAVTSPATRAPSGSSPTAAPPTTAATTASAAGKPCVKLADPLPSGAPPVPVKVGPPPTQLVTEDLKVGTGATVTATQTLTVNYIGVTCSTGRIFDSSYGGKQPATFPLSGVIKGWQAGIPGMKVGGQRLLGIPPDQAYGAQGYPPTIAPAETLWFVVEVVKAA